MIPLDIPMPTNALTVDEIQQKVAFHRLNKLVYKKKNIEVPHLAESIAKPRIMIRNKTREIDRFQSNIGQLKSETSEDLINEGSSHKLDISSDEILNEKSIPQIIQLSEICYSIGNKIMFSGNDLPDLHAKFRGSINTKRSDIEQKTNALLRLPSIHTNFPSERKESGYNQTDTHKLFFKNYMKRLSQACGKRYLLQVPEVLQQSEGEKLIQRYSYSYEAKKKEVFERSDSLEKFKKNTNIDTGVKILFSKPHALLKERNPFWRREQDRVKKESLKRSLLDMQNINLPMRRQYLQ